MAVLKSTNFDPRIPGTVTTTELGYLDGLSAAIQTQIDSRVSLSGSTMTGDLVVPAEAYGAGWNGVQEVPTKDALYDKIETLGGGLTIGQVYPVGSIYISTSSTNPGTTFGVGTWVAFGTGRTLVGIDTGQTEFDVVEETGGAKTHTLTVGEMPSHTHGIANTSLLAATGSTYAASASSTTILSTATGGDGAHNNLQPYIVVYMWKRTA